MAGGGRSPQLRRGRRCFGEGRSRTALVEKEGRNVCELFPAESSPLGIVPIVSAREVAFNLEDESFHIFTDTLTGRRGKPGWRRQKATSRFWRPLHGRITSILRVSSPWSRHCDWLARVHCNSVWSRSATREPEQGERAVHGVHARDIREFRGGFEDVVVILSSRCKTHDLI